MSLPWDIWNTGIEKGIPAEKALGGDWLSSKKVCSEDGRQKNLQPSSK